MRFFSLMIVAILTLTGCSRAKLEFLWFRNTLENARMNAANNLEPKPGERVRVVRSPIIGLVVIVDTGGGHLGGQGFVYVEHPQVDSKEMRSHFPEGLSFTPVHPNWWRFDESR